MGYDIFNRHNDYFRASIHVWPRLLYIARVNGWEPMGTHLDSANDWNGNYDTNDGQTICDADAKHLAAALESALQTGRGIAEALMDEHGSSLVPKLEAILGQSIVESSDDDDQRGTVWWSPGTPDSESIRIKIVQAVEFFRCGAASIY